MTCLIATLRTLAMHQQNVFVSVNHVVALAVTLLTIAVSRDAASVTDCSVPASYVCAGGPNWLYLF